MGLTVGQMWVRKTVSISASPSMKEAGTFPHFLDYLSMSCLGSHCNNLGASTFSAIFLPLTETLDAAQGSVVVKR